MLNSLIVAASVAGLVIAHGHVQEYTIDGTTYPAFDPQHDYDAKWNAKRIEWGFNKAKGNVGPVENVALPDIACRFNPLKEPNVEGVARAGAEIEFKWLDWFGNHKGPVMTVSIEVLRSFEGEFC
jgi:cellulase